MLRIAQVFRYSQVIQIIRIFLIMAILLMLKPMMLLKLTMFPLPMIRLPGGADAADDGTGTNDSADANDGADDAADDDTVQLLIEAQKKAVEFTGAQEYTGSGNINEYRLWGVHRDV